MLWVLLACVAVSRPDEDHILPDKLESLRQLVEERKLRSHVKKAVKKYLIENSLDPNQFRGADILSSLQKEVETLQKRLVTLRKLVQAQAKQRRHRAVKK